MTAIEWTDATWNPVVGCDRVSPGCANCYALELAPRLRAMQHARGDTTGVWATQADGGKSSGPAFAIRTVPERLEDPLRWRKPRMVFVNSMSDLFHEDVPDEFIVEVFRVMRWASQHTFQVLTKRPERVRPFLERHFTGLDDPPPNIWLGVSIENRRFVHRADVLREIPAAVRFISAEPLLGPLVNSCPICMGFGSCSHCDERPGLWLAGIDWLIVGGESGPRHRPMREEWVRDLADLADRAGTAFFFKQWGGRTPKAGGRMLDGRTWDEFPKATA